MYLLSVVKFLGCNLLLLNLDVYAIDLHYFLRNHPVLRVEDGGLENGNFHGE